MEKTKVTGGVVHKLPNDLKEALIKAPKALELWEDITPLARNEWICWATSAKKDDTREKRIDETIDKLLQGKRRPCCWAGCIHRTDKVMSPSQKWVYGKKNKEK